MARPTSGEPRDLRPEPDDETAEERQRLWFVAVPPALWMIHFLASYLTAAVWCAKSEPGAPLTAVRWAVAGYTVLALGGIAVAGWLAYRRYHFGAAAPVRHRDTPEDRHRFLGFVTLLLAGLSAVAVLYAALPALFIEICR